LPVVTWYQYDQNNEDPASDERVGNQWLRDNIPLFDAAFEGTYYWENIPKAWDKMTAELVAAVIAGGEVPDIVELGGAMVTTYVNNGALMDITDWVMAQSWYADMEEGALDTCRGTDGRLYCVPTAERPYLTYVWADRYPNGFPTTPEQFLVEAERLKAEGLYAWAYFGNTQYGGSGAKRGLYSIIASFGGGYEGPDGSMLLNTPENVAAISFVRDTVLKGYSPDTVFAGGFIEEDSFKDASAGAFPTGLFGYRYINPLTAPDGTKYETGTEQDMIDAIAAGDVIMRPMFAPEGKTPGCNIDVQGLGIPVGAANLQGAYDYINWLMTDEELYVNYVLGPGAGFPALVSVQQHPKLDTPFFQQAAIAINGSKCVMAVKNLERPDEASEMIMNVIYKLIKDEPTADIATELQKVQDEYNNN
jgi:multiple sugar transport system substrate-binding protein